MAMTKEYDFTQAERGKFYVPITEVRMLKSYEAKLNKGQIQWLGEQPDIESARILVTILEESQPKIKRHPPVSIAGQGQTFGNIFNVLDTDSTHEI